MPGFVLLVFFLPLLPATSQEPRPASHVEETGATGRMSETGMPWPPRPGAPASPSPRTRAWSSERRERTRLEWRSSGSKTGGVRGDSIPPTAVAWSSDGEALVVGTRTGRVESIPEAGEGEPRRIGELGSEVRHLDVESGGRRVLACTADFGLHLLEAGAPRSGSWGR